MTDIGGKRDFGFGWRDGRLKKEKKTAEEANNKKAGSEGED